MNPERGDAPGWRRSSEGARFGYLILPSSAAH